MRFVEEQWRRDYPENTVRAICRIACCMDPAKSTVYKFSNKAIALIVGFLPLPLLLMFVLDCHQMKAVMTLLKCAITYQQELSPFPKISRRVPRCGLFQWYIDTFCVCRQNFFMSDSKDGVDNVMTRCSICYEWFRKKMHEH